MKLLLLFPIAGAVADILVLAGIADLLSAYPNGSAFSIPWIRGFSAITLIAYIGMAVGLAYTLLRKFTLSRHRLERSVNSN